VGISHYINSCSSGSTLLFRCHSDWTYSANVLTKRRAWLFMSIESLSFTPPIISHNHQPPRRRRTTSFANHHIFPLSFASIQIFARFRRLSMIGSLFCAFMASSHHLEGR
jgi:hypothetical protein